MAEGTDIVIGTVADGDDEGSAATTLSKKVDAILAAHDRAKSHVSICMLQSYGARETPLAVAIVCWED
jgi:hypothetical protein